MKKQFVVTVLTLLSVAGYSQKYFTKSGIIKFDATTSTSPEKIEGINRTSVCVVDSKSGAIQFAVLMKGFAFEKALMEEHFNENYVESNKFPKTEFKGEIKNKEDLNFSKDGVCVVKVKGKLTMHGETKDVEADAKFTILNGKITANAEFDVKLEDFKISVPGLVADKVAKVAKIIITCSLESLKS